MDIETIERLFAIYSVEIMLKAVILCLKNIKKNVCVCLSECMRKKKKMGGMRNGRHPHISLILLLDARS